ncbi:hypothetical protein CVT25_009298 [Psilocybe cyanescens]|uniref:MYND-type domain-containing protein n=1 Tax=Psilocybe cyanescens TaxID=93625 RepID=A0A409WW39_PSICY|nr:hypothetical protein CVT25_009298 [Psilocybe cyanescens]
MAGPYISEGPKTVLTDFWKNNCADDPEFAFEQYVQMYHSCFMPATSPGPYGLRSSSYFHREGIRECRERLLTRQNTEISAGASQEKVDDLLELGLRVASGTHLKFDEATGIALFQRVVQGDYAKAKKAIAASLICQCLKRRLLDSTQQFDTIEAFKWADLSCEYGLFSHCSLHLVLLYDRLGKAPLDRGNFAKFTHIWTAYDNFREETGLQRPRSRYCENCYKKPRRRSLLKRCAGDCIPDNKPVYCGRKCQKEHWSKYRQWCKFETVDTDSEWTTDSEREDWEYSEGEGAPELPDVPPGSKVEINFASCRH